MERASCLFLGLASVDLIYQLDNFPAPDSKNNCRDLKISGGGPALNAAVTFSFLGGKSKLISAFGKHHLAEIIKKDLSDNNVDFSDLFINTLSPPILSSIIISGDGERTIITSKPEFEKFSGIELEAEAEKHDALLLDGFFPEAAIEAAKIFHRENKPVVFDGGSWKEKMEELLPFVTDAICSSSFFVPGLKSKSEILNYLMKSGVERAAVTNGGNAINFKTKNESGKVFPPKIQPVDTSAAGDIFHGAYVYYFLKYQDFEIALNHASKTAAESCKYFGSRKWKER